MAFSTVAGLRSNVTAGGFRLHAESRALQRSMVSSSKAGVISARLRPKATWFGQPARCVDVSAEAPAFGTMKKVSGHHGFHWSIYATRPTSEPAEEPENQEPSLDDGQEICDNHNLSPDDASKLFKEDVQSINQSNKPKIRSSDEYMKTDHVNDDDALAEARDVAEFDKEIYKMRVMAQLEELFRKASSVMRLDVCDYAFLAILIGVFVLSGVAIYKSVLSEPVAQLLQALLPILKKVYGNLLYYAVKYGRVTTSA